MSSLELSVTLVKRSFFLFFFFFYFSLLFPIMSSFLSGKYMQNCYRCEMWEGLCIMEKKFFVCIDLKKKNTHFLVVLAKPKKKIIFFNSTPGSMDHELYIE